MAEGNCSSAPVESRHALAAALEQGCKPDRNTWRIGTEHEKLPYQTADLRPVPYEGPNGIGALLQGLAARTGWTEVMEQGRVIALKDGKGASITLEPGGQFELSGAPLQNLHETCAEIATHLADLHAVAGPMGLGFAGIGFSPLWSLEETPIMPKGRYGIMRAYMQRVGRLGRQMMFRSCTVQTNLDFASEADMVKKMRVALALQPIATALFANSPFAEGRPNGYLSYRAHVWSDTDPDRTGMLPFVFEDGFGFERYVDYALDVPMYFVYRNGDYLDASGLSFRDFMAGRLSILPGERPTLKDWEDHLTTIFPEVRLKTFLEMRGADGGPRPMLCALAAFWTGLLYDDAALEAAWRLVAGWSAEEREAVRRTAPALGLRTPTPAGPAREVARAALLIARDGLKARAALDSAGENETVFLDPLEEIAESGVTLAERMLGAYHGAWNRDIRHAFAATAY